MMAKIPGTEKDLGMYWSCSAVFYQIFIFISLSFCYFHLRKRIFFYWNLLPMFRDTYNIYIYKIWTSVKILYFILFTGTEVKSLLDPQENARELRERSWFLQCMMTTPRLTPRTHYLGGVTTTTSSIETKSTSQSHRKAKAILTIKKLHYIPHLLL